MKPSLTPPSPGPWTHGTRDGFWVDAICGPDDVRVAMIYGLPCNTRVRDMRPETMHPTEAVAMANARLIAAAPDLYEALRPFAAFADAWDRNPIKGLDDTLYSIHSAEEGASFKLSDCIRARAALHRVEAPAKEGNS